MLLAVVALNESSVPLAIVALNKSCVLLAIVALSESCLLTIDSGLITSGYYNLH